MDGGDVCQFFDREDSTNVTVEVNVSCDLGKTFERIKNNDVDRQKEYVS